MPSRGSDPDDIAWLRSMAKEFTEGFNSGDVDRLMRYYGDTYVDVNLRDPVQTWAERRAYYSHVMQHGGFRVAVRADEIQVHGDFAFVRGTLELLRPEGPRSELRYLEILQRHRDGGWRVMWGMDGPIQEYVRASEP